MKLLLIEDDVHLTLALYRALGSIYKIESSKSGLAGLKKAEAGDFDVILLDLNLPDTYGLSVCEKLRAAGIKTPILVISADNTIKSKVTLLDSGANDYLAKPFSFDELQARIRALTRSASQKRNAAARLVSGDLVLDSLKHVAERNGKPLSLTRKEFALLECLMSGAGAVVSRKELAEYVWSNDWQGATNTIDVHVKYLRDKLDKRGQPLIKTVRGVGYRLEITARSSREKCLN